MSSLLRRGIFLEETSRAENEALGVHSFLRRGLEGNGSNSTNTSSSGGDNDSFLMLVTIIVGLIVLFYGICTFQCIRVWLRRKCCSRNRDDPAESADTVLVHEGTVFNLSGDQRRAVLEAIFSETSKAVTDKDVEEAKKRKKEEKKEENVPLNVEIPGVSTAGTEDSMETKSPRSSEQAADLDDLDSEDDIENARSLDDDHFEDDSEEEMVSLPDNSEDEVDSVRSASPSLEDGIQRMEDVVRSPTENTDIYEHEHIIHTTPKANNRGESLQGDMKPPAITTLTPDGTSLYLSDAGNTYEKDDDDEEKVRLDLSDKLLSLPKLSAVPRSATLTIPEDKTFEETKEEIQSNAEQSPVVPPAEMPISSGCHCEETKEEIINERSESPSGMMPDDGAIPLPIPLLRRESFSTVASEYTYDDDSTGDNVCPVCLSGYKKGDMLIVSKYCTHAFHKDCILEWLEKHDECPVCRTAMVTDSEMSRAATSLIGKTRMYRAVASYQSASQHYHSPPPSPHDRSHPTSLSQTMRRVYSTPYR